MENSKEIIKTEEIKKYYYIKTTIFGKYRQVKAVDGISISIKENNVFAIVGESGCGKSTLAKLMLGLIKPTSGRVLYKGKDIKTLKKNEIKNFRKKIQIVFQDPFASLNPRMSVFSILSEPLKIHTDIKGSLLKDKVVYLLETVGLKSEHLHRYPHEFSGGQRQRICIARAIALEPELIIADEPLSALDVSIGAQILNLLIKLKEKKKMSFLFISHNLNLVNYFAEYVAVMYLGKIVEEGPVKDVFYNPKHFYTKKLIQAIPKLKTNNLIF